MKNVICIISAIFLVLGLAFSFNALATNEHGQGPNSNSANSNNSLNAVKIYENTAAGKKQAEWSEGRVIKPCESIQAKHPAFSRGTIATDCKK